MEYKTKFYLSKKTEAQTSDIPVRFSFIFDNQRFMSTTGLKANENQWSRAKQCFKSGASNAEAKNATLKEISDQLEKIYLESTNKGTKPTVEYIQKAYRKKAQPLNFFDYFNEFVNTEGKNKAWSLATHAKFKTLKMHLDNFQKSENFNLTFSEINREFYQKMFDYFVSIGHRNSSIKKSFRNIDWFLNWCVKSKEMNIPKIGDFELKDPPTVKNADNIVFLEPHEFLMMYEANIPDLRLTRVKDVFSFLCATGLRFSDYAALKPQNITENSIKLTTQKTAETIEQPLNEFSKAILEKYKNQLPKYSNATLNRYVKELAKILCFKRQTTHVYIKAGKQVRQTNELWEVLTTHSGRRTFVSLSIALNMNPEIIMRFTGHKTNEMLRVYTGVTNDEKRVTMSVFNIENIKSKIAN